MALVAALFAGWQDCSNEEMAAGECSRHGRDGISQVAPNSRESITIGRQAGRQSFSPSDWRLIGGRQLLGKSRRELTLLVHFFWVSFFLLHLPCFVCKKTEHLVWLIAAANRQSLNLSPSLSPSLSLTFASQPMDSPGRHYRFVIIKITSIKRPVDGHRHNGPE